MINEKLLEVLACPICKKDLNLIEKNREYFLKCNNCNVLYPIIDDIPILLKEEAIKEESIE